MLTEQVEDVAELDWDDPTSPELTPDAPGTPPTDPEAPFGRMKNGRPYKSSPAQRRASAKASQKAREASAAYTPAKTRGRSSGKPTTDYRPALTGLMQIPQFLLGMAARWKPELGYDAVAVAMHSPPLVEALNETAKTDERLAKVLDRLTAVGPYGLVLAAAMPMAMQIAANHKIIPTNRDMGILTQEELASVAEQMTPGDR